MSVDLTDDPAALPSGITLVTGAGGMPAVAVETSACTATVYLNGAHVTAWTPAGAEPVLWLSEASRFAPGAAIRGGVPICAPWFGPGRGGDKSPAHGFFRLAQWRLVEASVDDSGTAVLGFALTLAECTGLPGVEGSPTFSARYVVTAGRDLDLALTVTAGDVDLDLEAALHTYLAVSDARTVRINGLDGTAYVDKVAGVDDCRQEGDVSFGAEVDRVYDATGPVLLVDTERTITVSGEGATKTVVWNPWISKAAAMPDYGDDEWPEMVCIEAANALDGAVTVPSQRSHTLRQRLTLA